MALLGSLLWDSVAALLVLLAFIYIYGTSTYGYFKKRGIPYVKATIPFAGNFGGLLLGTHILNDLIQYQYNQLKKHRFGGIFLSRVPAVMICDPELAKMVLTKDFSSLHDHSVPEDETDVLSVNLFNVTGARWKNLRSKLSPVFTSGKLKQMFPLMLECSEELSSVIRKKAVNGDNVQLKDLLIRYSTDVIGTCAFGIQCHSLSEPNPEFYKLSQQVLKPSLVQILRFTVLANNKIIAKLFPMDKLFGESRDFFIKLMAETIKYRKENNVERNDFVQMLMQLQKNDEHKTKHANPDEVIFTDSVIAAQGFFFFLAGLDAISNIVGFALYHLSLDTTVQDDLADEVLSVISHNNGKITYESLKEMKLLEMVLSEALRMHGGGALFREVTSPSYTIPGSNFTLQKGMQICVPNSGLHYDPDIYPDPKRFDPYRFTEEAISKRHPFAYLPFGEGPRVCIANRFAMFEMKLCLAALIRDFKFNVCSETQIPIKHVAYAFTPSPTKGFVLKVEERKP